MRNALVIAIILLAGSFVMPSVTAAAPLLTDAEGDVECIASAGGTPLPGAPCSASVTQGTDLLSLSVGETEEELSLTIAVASMQGGIVQSTAVEVFFDWNTKTYIMKAGFFSSEPIGSETSTYAYLLVEEGGDQDWVAELAEPVAERDAGTITVMVPKVYVLDAQKRIPGRGDTISVTQVVSEPGTINFFLAGASYRDAMPDEPKPTPYTLTMGDVAQGDIMLIAPERVRVSNGGATTFVFKIEVRNPGAIDQEYALSALDLPVGWNATVQSSVKVAAKETKPVSVLLSVPFAHEHGGFSGFNFTAQSTRDANTNARVRLGVLHTPIPQPAGHHSELYLHASGDRGPLGAAVEPVFPYAWGWMNTQGEHTDDHAFVTPSNGGGFNVGGGDRTYWFIGLDPGLLVGLDFDLERVAKFDGAILGGRVGESEIRADLYYWSDTGSGGESILLAEGDAAPITLDLQNPTPFSLTLTPTVESDYIAHAPDSYIWLEISLPRSPTEGMTPSQTPRLMVEPFKLALPLNEYHDRLTGDTEAANAIVLTAKGVVEKVGRPGTVLTYIFDVKNPGAADTLVLDLAGGDIDQARLVPRGTLSFAAGETREVTIAVEIPFDANVGEEFEVLLFVHSRDDPSKMAIARTKTRATNVAGDAMADESATLLAAQAREDQTPGAGIIGAAVALAAAAVVMRRRR